MTNQTIEQAVEERFNGSNIFWKVILKNLTPETISFIKDDYTQALQAQRDVGAREVELTHFVWCPQCGDALEQTGTQNKYNCFGCDTDYQLKALTPPTK